VDPTFTPGTGPNGLVSGLGVSADGRISVGGAFNSYNGSAYNRLVRLTTNGLPDIAFTTPLTFDAGLNALAVQSDGRTIVVGGFKTPVSGYARIRANASLDLLFDPGSGADAPVFATALQTNGQVLIAGAFTNVAGVYRPGVARLSSNAVVDNAFGPISISNGTVFAVAPTADGKVVIGGSFRFINAAYRSGIARLNADGSLDTSFNPMEGVLGNVYTVSVLPDGGVFIGGDFTTVNGITRRRYALLLTNGLVDPRFDSSIGADNTVYASLVTPEKQIVIGGDFTTIGGVPRRGVARINLGDLPPLVPVELTIEIVSNAAHVSVFSIPGRSYVLEGSTNLLYWFNLSTNVATGSLLDFIDPNVSGNGQRFYRARLLSP
jgi:uncharacterized delta-60 repeat protein